MPRGVPESRGSVPRAKSSPVTAPAGSTVVSRSSIPRQRRVPPRRGGSGGSIPEMKASVIARTPMSNRQRIATNAALEMSMNMKMNEIDLADLEDDVESINSNVSTGSEELKGSSPTPQSSQRTGSSRGERSMDSQRRRSSSQKASTARQHRDRDRRDRRRSKDSSEERPERPTSASSLDDSEEPRRESALSMSSSASRSSNTSCSKSDSSCNTTERRTTDRDRGRDRDNQSTRHRSSSQKRGDVSKRSSSLHEKRNRRSHLLSNWKEPTPARSNERGFQVPKTAEGRLKREKVTEREILALLSDDYEMPLTEDLKDTADNNMNNSVSSLGSVNDVGTSRSQRKSRSSGKPPASRTKSPSKYRDQSPSGDRSVRRSRSGTISKSPSRTSGSKSPKHDVGDTAETTHDLNAGHMSLSALSSSRAPRVRRPPQRSKSDASDNALDSFLQQNVAVSRRKKSTSGSRSVASVPASAKARRRRFSVSDRTDETEDTTKPSSIPYIDDDNETPPLSDHLDKKRSSSRSNTDDDDASVGSMDLDLATGRSFQQQRFNEKIQLHLSRTDNLLYSVFPRHIADALRNGQKIEPENHDLVTIFFSDIVGFTDISAKLDPIKISDMLDRLYHSFDALSDYHDVFKVETIGDAYMAVTNLAKKQSDHAKRIAEFAIDAIRVANQTLIDEDDPKLGFVNIRVGFHSGPVVSNVVGTRNPRYCLFGDTVNTASRMESNSQCNRIHCSEASAILLKQQCPKIRIFPRGEIEVKGKGKMKTFWIHTEGATSAEGGSEKKQNIFNNVLNSLRREKVAT